MSRYHQPFAQIGSWVAFPQSAGKGSIVDEWPKHKSFPTNLVESWKVNRLPGLSIIPGCIVLGRKDMNVGARVTWLLRVAKTNRRACDEAWGLRQRGQAFWGSCAGDRGAAHDLWRGSPRKAARRPQLDPVITPFVHDLQKSLCPSHLFLPCVQGTCEGT